MNVTIQLNIDETWSYENVATIYSDIGIVFFLKKQRFRIDYLSVSGPQIITNDFPTSHNVTIVELDNLVEDLHSDLVVVSDKCQKCLKL